jgi:hypothetical protein
VVEPSRDLRDRAFLAILLLVGGGSLASGLYNLLWLGSPSPTAVFDCTLGVAILVVTWLFLAPYVFASGSESTLPVVAATASVPAGAGRPRPSSLPEHEPLLLAAERIAAAPPLPPRSARAEGRTSLPEAPRRWVGRTEPEREGRRPLAARRVTPVDPPAARASDSPPPTTGPTPAAEVADVLSELETISRALRDSDGGSTRRPGEDHGDTDPAGPEGTPGSGGLFRARPKSA